MSNLEAALAALQARGFVNYFGLQRFGSNPDAGSHMMGAALLRSDYRQVGSRGGSHRIGIPSRSFHTTRSTSQHDHAHDYIGRWIDMIMIPQLGERCTYMHTHTHTHTHTHCR